MKTRNLRTGTRDLEIHDGEHVNVLQSPESNTLFYIQHKSNIHPVSEGHGSHLKNPDIEAPLVAEN